MSVIDSTSFPERERKPAALKSYPRTDIPRKYRSQEAAESVAENYARMTYFTRRGEPYVYECTECQAFHVGLNTKNQPWHVSRYRHDQHLDHVGQHPETNAA